MAARTLILSSAETRVSASKRPKSLLSSNSHQTKQQEPFCDWIKALFHQEKEKLLLETVTGQSTVANQLQAHLNQKFAPKSEGMEQANGAQRSIAELKNLATVQRSERHTQEQAAAKAKRRQYLESLKSQQNQIWNMVNTLIACKRGKPYDQAVQHLTDLRDLADLEGNSAMF